MRGTEVNSKKNNGQCRAMPFVFITKLSTNVQYDNLEVALCTNEDKFHVQGFEN